MRSRIRRDGTALLFLLAACNLQAQESTVCSSLKSPQDVLTCVKLRHPAVLQAQAEGEVKTAAIGTAGIRPNPEVEARVLFGAGDHDSPVLSETNFFYPIEAGGKRGARLEKARTEAAVSQTAVLENSDEAIVQTVLRLHRLRQIHAEKKTLAEVQSTYRRIVGLYRGRPLLSPEQESSLIVFQSSLEEGGLHKTELENEEERTHSALRLSLAEEVVFSPALLPATPRTWPETNAESVAAEEWAPVKRARAELKSAEASTRLAKSEAWPTMKVGPSIETDSPLGNTKTAAGFIFSTELPFTNRNQGKKAEAKREENLAHLNLRLREREAEEAARRWNREYRTNVQALQRARKGFAFAERHEKLEVLFDRGLIPTALLLEAHRQMLELQAELHKTELKAIEALWRIYALQGRAAEERI